MTQLLAATKSSGLASEWLVGASVSKISYFVTGWEIQFLSLDVSADIHFYAAELMIPDIQVWREAFAGLPIDILNTNEPDDVIVGAQLLSAMNYSRVEGVLVNDSGVLELGFDNSIVVHAEAKIDMVDWTWSLKNTSTDEMMTCDSGPIYLSKNVSP